MKYGELKIGAVFKVPGDVKHFLKTCDAKRALILQDTLGFPAGDTFHFTDESKVELVEVGLNPYVKFADLYHGQLFFSVGKAKDQSYFKYEEYGYSLDGYKKLFSADEVVLPLSTEYLMGE